MTNLLLDRTTTLYKYNAKELTDVSNERMNERPNQYQSVDIRYASLSGSLF